MILVVVDQFTAMAHFIPLSKNNSLTVAKEYLDNVCKQHRFAENNVSEGDRTFTGQYFKDLYDFLGIKRNITTAFHLERNAQTERRYQVIEYYL